MTNRLIRCSVTAGDIIFKIRDVSRSSISNLFVSQVPLAVLNGRAGRGCHQTETEVQRGGGRPEVRHVGAERTSRAKPWTDPALTRAGWVREGRVQGKERALPGACLQVFVP